MSIEALSPLLSATATSLAHAPSAVVERAAHDVASQTRRVDSDEKAAGAAGVSAADGEDNTTDEHHADGRSPWELPARGAEPQAAAVPAVAADARSDKTVGLGLDLTA